MNCVTNYSIMYQLALVDLNDFYQHQPALLNQPSLRLSWPVGIYSRLKNAIWPFRAYHNSDFSFKIFGNPLLRIISLYASADLFGVRGLLGSLKSTRWIPNLTRYPSIHSKLSRKHQRKYPLTRTPSRWIAFNASFTYEVRYSTRCVSFNASSPVRSLSPSIAKPFSVIMMSGSS